MKITVTTRTSYNRNLVTTTVMATTELGTELLSKTSDADRDQDWGDAHEEVETVEYATVQKFLAQGYDGAQRAMHILPDEEVAPIIAQRRSELAAALAAKKKVCKCTVDNSCWRFKRGPGWVPTTFDDWLLNK